MYAAINEAKIYETVVNNKGKKIINRILMGTYVSITETNGDWYKVITAGPDGWMHKEGLTDKMGLKIFFLDVGQGDGILIEIGNYKILLDAGPNENLYRYLTKWQYTYLLNADEKVHIYYLIVTHFDNDHYKGFI
jgi:beta-lactamase superfamily II metal-dependent hydrolase